MMALGLVTVLGSHRLGKSASYTFENQLRCNAGAIPDARKADSYAFGFDNEMGLAYRRQLKDKKGSRDYATRLEDCPSAGELEPVVAVWESDGMKWQIATLLYKDLRQGQKYKDEPNDMPSRDVGLHADLSLELGIGDGRTVRSRFRAQNERNDLVILSSRKIEDDSNWRPCVSITITPETNVSTAFGIINKVCRALESKTIPFTPEAIRALRASLLFDHRHMPDTLAPSEAAGDAKGTAEEEGADTDPEVKTDGESPSESESLAEEEESESESEGGEESESEQEEGDKSDVETAPEKDNED